MPQFQTLKELFSVLQEKSSLAQRIYHMVSNNNVLSIFVDSEMLTYWTTQANNFDLKDLDFPEADRLNLVQAMVSFLNPDIKLDSSRLYLTQTFEEGCLDLLVDSDYMSLTVHKTCNEGISELVAGNVQLEHSIYF